MAARGRTPPDAVIRAAQASQTRWGIPASVTLAQWALESAWGSRMPPGSNNPFGIKAGGEGGTTPAPAAVINAIVDALHAHGVREIGMPASPDKVWNAIIEGVDASRKTR